MTDEFPNIIVVCFTSCLYLNSRIFKLNIQKPLLSLSVCKEIATVYHSPSTYAFVFNMYQAEASDGAISLESSSDEGHPFRQRT
jgi:hypothetical protein